MAAHASSRLFSGRNVDRTRESGGNRAYLCYGKPETRRHDRRTSLDRLRLCYADWSPCRSSTYRWGDFDELVVPRDKHRNFKSYDIVDIHHALVKLDERKCVDKYPKEGPESVKQRELIDKRRAEVERELEEAIADPDGGLRYSWLVAQRRVRDCFAGNFAGDQWTIEGGVSDSYNIVDIYDAFVRWHEVREIAEAKRAALEKEYAEAKTAEGNVKLRLYSKIRAVNRIMHYELYSHCGLHSDDILPDQKSDYDIFNIHEALVKFDGKFLEKYPEEGPGSEELKKLIDKHRADLKEEYQKATTNEVSIQSLPEYTKSEAERRVRDCFAGAFPSDTEIVPKKEKDESDQTYDISDIKKAIDLFDAETFLDLCKYASKGQPGCDKINQEVDQERASIQKEFDEASSDIEIEHGSGFIVCDHCIVTNKHVIETYLNEMERHKIYISNAVIDDLPCIVIRFDVGRDLALLHCPDLNLEQCEICPLQLSNQSVLPGMSIFTFGYPMSHTEETALFVSGNVSGSKRTLAGHSLIVLNCSLNSGNSGGPVLHWVNGQLKVVGVATQKHFKEILTFEERETVEKIRKSLQTHAISDVPDSVIDYLSCRDASLSLCEIPISILTLKLYEALETHSQFNLSNALPAKLVVDFISEYAGEHKKDLAEMVKLANTL